MRTLVLSAQGSGNALGRAISMAMVAGLLGPVDVWAPADGPLWVGASQFDVPVQRFRRIADVMRSATSPGREPTVVWVSKGLAPLDRIAVACAKRGISVILDEDDDEIGLADEFRSRSVTNRLRLNSLRRGSPRRLARAQAVCGEVCVGRTYSSSGLVGEGSRHRTAIIPHVRAANARPRHQVAGDTGELSLGLLGTLRPHKGGDVLVRLVASDPRLRGVTFRQTGWEPPAYLRGRWTELPPTTTLDEAYDHVDLCVLPSSMTDRGSRLQFPVKALDALARSVPVAASPLPALIEHIGRGAFIAVDDWTEPSQTLRSIRTHDLPSVGAAGQLAFRQRLTPEAVAPGLYKFIASIASL